MHSDQGVQFTSWEFVNFCKENNITQSMSKAGCPYDNAPMERFYNTFKSNFYNITSFSNVEMMDELTMKYINWYNYVRPHSYNNYLTPMEARYRQVFIEQSVTKKLDHNKYSDNREKIIDETLKVTRFLLTNVMDVKEESLKEIDECFSK